ncbi:hypothetical protein, partial [Oleidesulfovibrio alaskensis]
MRHRKFIVLTIIALALLITGAKAKADDLLKSDKITQAIRLYQGNLIFPPPFWVRQVKDIANTKSFQKQQGNLFTLEQIPKEQEFDSWTNLYGVYGYYLPEYDMKRFINESLNALALGCKVQGKSKLISVENGKIIMTYFCRDLHDPFVIDGRNTESGFLFISQVEQSFAKVYMAWRAKKEDMHTDRWPMDE